MRLNHVFVGSLILTGIPIVAHGQATGLPAMCTNVLNDVTVRVEEISERYADEGQAGSQAFSQEAEQIKEDQPTPGIEGAIQMDIDVTMQRHDVFVDVPQVTMKTQELSLDFPTIEMRPTEWSWDQPTVVVRHECRGGPDEFVCEDGGTYTDDFGFEWLKPPHCYTRPGADICLDVPYVEMRTEKISFDNPVLVMKTVPFKMDVPEFEMKAQKIAFDLPSITIKNLSVETAKIQERAEALKSKANQYQTNLSTRMQAEIKATHGDVLTKSKSCIDTEFQKLVATNLKSIDDYIAVTTAAIDLASSRGNPELAAQQQTQRDQLLVSRESVIRSLEQAKITMLGQIKKALDTMTSA